MPVADISTKTTAKTAAPVPAAKPAETLRQAQPRKLSPSSLYPTGQDYDIFAVKIPAGWDFEDLLQPIAWTNVCNVVAKDITGRREKIGSLIYVREEKGAFAAWLSIEAVTANDQGNPNGLEVACMGPSHHPQTGAPWAVVPRTGKPWVSKTSAN